MKNFIKDLRGMFSSWVSTGMLLLMVGGTTYMWFLAFECRASSDFVEHSMVAPIGFIYASFCAFVTVLAIVDGFFEARRKREWAEKIANKQIANKI